MRSTRTWWMFASTVMACGWLTAVASAQPQMGACRPDVEKFCSGVEPGGGRIIECLREHKAQLSPDCAKMFEAAGRGAAKTPAAK